MVKLGNALIESPQDRKAIVDAAYKVSRALREFLNKKNNKDWKISIGTVKDDKSTITNLK